MYCWGVRADMWKWLMPLSNAQSSSLVIITFETMKAFPPLTHGILHKNVEQQVGNIIKPENRFLGEAVLPRCNTQRPGAQASPPLASAWLWASGHFLRFHVVKAKLDDAGRQLLCVKGGEKVIVEYLRILCMFTETRKPIQHPIMHSGCSVLFVPSP